MLFSNAIICVDSHTAGEPTRVVLSGLPFIQGLTLAEKTDYFSTHYDHYRKTLTGEPRGHAPVHAAVVTQPTSAEADFGLIIMSALGYSAMCGHLLIGTVTSLLEIGIYSIHEPYTHLVVETLAGLIRTRAEVKDGKVQSVSFQNQASYALLRDFEVETADHGKLLVDIAYGGMWYVIVNVDQIKMPIELKNVEELRRAGAAIRESVNQEIKNISPANPGFPAVIPQLLFTGKPKSSQANGRNFVTSSELGFDRSPCGTGSSAKLALLYARRELGLDQVYIHESVVDTVFHSKLISVKMLEEIEAVIPEITGSAYITGINQLLIDPSDPIKHGFFVTG